MNDYPLESFVFYRSFRDAIEEMPDDEKLATLLGICDYALYGVEPKLKGVMSRAVFTVARPSIDANNCRRTNGKKGGRPPKKPMVSNSENQWFSKSESTETESGSETESESESKKESTSVRPDSQEKKIVKPETTPKQTDPVKQKVEPVVNDIKQPVTAPSVPTEAEMNAEFEALIASGKNKGSVKISGIGPDYGGDVTVKFNIGKKVIAY